ncbi:hypothetical protein HK405_015619, partial [Cladochytrium tenue]
NIKGSLRAPRFVQSFLRGTESRIDDAIRSSPPPSLRSRPSVSSIRTISNLSPSSMNGPTSANPNRTSDSLNSAAASAGAHVHYLSGSLFAAPDSPSPAATAFLAHNHRKMSLGTPSSMDATILSPMASPTSTAFVVSRQLDADEPGAALQRKHTASSSLAHLRKNSAAAASISSPAAAAAGAPGGFVNYSGLARSNSFSTGPPRHIAAASPIGRRPYEAERGGFGATDDDDDDDSMDEDDDSASVWVRQGIDPSLAVPGSCADVSSIRSGVSTATTSQPFYRPPPLPASATVLCAASNVAAANSQKPFQFPPSPRQLPGRLQSTGPSASATVATTVPAPSTEAAAAAAATYPSPSSPTLPNVPADHVAPPASACMPVSPSASPPPPARAVPRDPVVPTAGLADQASPEHQLYTEIVSAWNL